MTQNLKILIVTAEAAPYATIGGLGQVAYYLPRALKKLGTEVAVFIPKYGTIDEKKFKIRMLYKGLMVPTGDSERKELVCNVKVRQGTKREPTVYFLENMEYYEQRANVYGYADDHIRFALLSRGVLEFTKLQYFKPTVLHCNDWHTGYVPNYLRTEYAGDAFFRNVTTVFTIHNLKNQGIFDFRFASPMDFDDGKSAPASFFDPQLKKQNALKRGIIYADLVNTVSETYAREMMTDKYGEGLSELIKEARDKIFGVLNGLDYNDFDPQNDKAIAHTYSWKNFANRKLNKKVLQREFSLDENPDIPILAYSGRLDSQKGIELLMSILPHLLGEYAVQFVILGTGDSKYKEFFTKLEADFPGRVGTHLMKNFVLPRKIYAGADILLLPSKFEPCGIVTIEGMRYGLVPVVRKTGGLADIVTDFNPQKGIGNGFTFKNFSDLSFFGSVVRAIHAYWRKSEWERLVKSVMKEDFSWGSAAEKYLDLYERAVEFRRDRQSPVTNIGRQIEY
ncbi:hypothetical protein A2154_01805 [Candidatus Gottesmanbacteria bacterium RBG_16_43_7]|uniref:Glycogen synthase n=1 Tax=Candidatus Gottesmanbacteria bacterium RBG_16_43_7 TaxID=1798373 RepID=A0A1F5Z971_9BACT|nr:MAG: hypothetical protein A2154_01805 [Candidatus Gottesmanbacteria bacterium RBG_16_43_7]